MTALTLGEETMPAERGGAPHRIVGAFGPLRTVHLINSLRDATGGSELRTVTLFDELRSICSVRLWSPGCPDPALTRRYPVERIEPRRLRFPKTGVFVFVGVYRLPGRWLRLTRPRRVIVVYNTPDPALLDEFLATARRHLRRPVEIVYASEALRRAAGLPGVVQASPIDLELFSPGERQRTDAGDGEFRVGRLSRDTPVKHHHLDAALYQQLIARGARVRVMGGTCLAASAPVAAMVQGGRLELLPAGAMEPQRFLRELDCFVYRTSEEWTEPFGRVVVEAMACALPVVCCNRGGYAEVIEHERNGFLFESNAEALAIVERLRREPVLRRAVGRAARETVERLYSVSRRRETVAYYVG